MTLGSVLLFGFLLGLKHATEADHVAAVATFATQRHAARDAWRMGAAWGLGHALTLTAFGGLVLALGQAISPRLESALELLVGIMLAWLGADVLWRRQRAFARGASFTLLADQRPHPHPHPLPRRAVLVGMMHGLAGSAALVILSLHATSSPALGGLYVLIFGAGSILGMALLSCVIAIPLRRSAIFGLHHGLTVAVGLFSAGLGAWVVVQRAAEIAAG